MSQPEKTTRTGLVVRIVSVPDREKATAFYHLLLEGKLKRVLGGRAEKVAV